jgi:hypothetical protein
MNVKLDVRILILSFPVAAALFGGGFYGVYANLGPYPLYDIMFGVGLLGLCLNIIISFLLCLDSPNRGTR